MAQVPKPRKARFFCCTLAVALLLGGGEAAPVWSLSLPLETPTVSVPTPPPVKAPTVTVAVPTVTTPPPIKTPTVTVKTPTVPIKVPTVPVKTTTVPIKTTTTTSVPSVTVKAPSVTVKAPSISADTSVGSVHTTTGSSTTPTVSGTGLTGRTSGSGTSTRGATTGSAPLGAAGTVAGAGSAGGSGALASSTLGTYGSPGAGYGEMPPIEGALGRRARARIARREHLLKATVARFQGCLVALPASNRQLLELRTGYGDARPLSPRATAARLHVPAGQFAQLEKRAMHELSDAAATHACARTGEVVAAALSVIGAGLGGGHPGAIGLSDVASFKASRPLPSSPGRTLVGRVLGADVPPVASDLIILLLLGTLLGGAVVLLFADAAGHGPRHEEWRRRVLNRLRALH